MGEQRNALAETLSNWAEGAYKSINDAIMQEAQTLGIKPEDIQSGKYALTVEEQKGDSGGYKQLLYSCVDQKKNRVKIMAVEFMPNGFVLIGKKRVELLKHRGFSPNMRVD